MGTEHHGQPPHPPASGRPVELRSRERRLVEDTGRIAAHAQPYRPPVLPGGWAPLSAEQQAAVLAACDGAPESLVLRLGSLWEPGAEYRVYRLANELWGGLSLASKAVADDADSFASPPPAIANRTLLGLAWETCAAVRIALDFYNRDLEARGQDWRLQVRTP